MSITELLSSHATVKDPVCCNKTQNRQINNFFKSICWKKKKSICRKGKRTDEKEEGKKGEITVVHLRTVWIASICLVLFTFLIGC